MPTGTFFAPESHGSFLLDNPAEEEDGSEVFSLASAWDVATRYHEFKTRRLSQSQIRRLRHISVEAVLQRAQQVLGSVVHPTQTRTAPLSELPQNTEQVDFDIEETIDQSPIPLTERSLALSPADLYMSYSVYRTQPVVLSVDTSLSMTGEKLALTAVALAVVLLQFPDDPVGIVAFENEAKVVKDPSERISVATLVERFLDVPAQGYTHLEDGLKAALKMVEVATRRGRGRPASTVLLTDGKYTAGRDPAYLAPRFPHLVVLKMGNEKSSRNLCAEMAQAAGGTLREVGDLEILPLVMYGVVKDLLRGRS
jgi:Mg-chelatase subunit ChlD